MMKNQLKNDGFVICEKLIDTQIIDNIILNFLYVFNSQLLLCNENKKTNIEDAMIALFDINHERYVQTVTSLFRQLNLQNLFYNEKILEKCRILFNSNNIYCPGGTNVHVASNSLRTPGRYMGQPAHQDFPSVQGSIDGLIVWVPLMDIFKDLYPLEIIPGSNNNGIYQTYDDDEHPQYQIKSDQISDNDFIPVECSMGDVIFMTNFTVHRSGQIGEKNKIRIAASSRFDNGEEPSFIDRGYPTAYKRIVERKPMHDVNKFL